MYLMSEKNNPHQAHRQQDARKIPPITLMLTMVRGCLKSCPVKEKPMLEMISAVGRLKIDPRLYTGRRIRHPPTLSSRCVPRVLQSSPPSTSTVIRYYLRTPTSRSLGEWAGRFAKVDDDVPPLGSGSGVSHVRDLLCVLCATKALEE